MRNLHILNVFSTNLTSSVDEKIDKTAHHGHFSFITVDPLTPDLYLGHSRGFVTLNSDGKVKETVDLLKLIESVAEDGDTVNDNDRVIHLEYLLDQQLLFFATKSGKLCTYDSYSKQAHCHSDIGFGIETLRFSPDFDLITLITENRFIIILSRDYEPIVETCLDADGFGQDAFITVGWGKKETQFHGSAGKSAAISKQEEPPHVLLWDDQRPCISWRGDGQYFATSSVGLEISTRIIRIWTREGVHSATSESVNGLEQNLSWRPSGNLIASSQLEKSGEHRIIFYERNGLRHGEFSLPQMNNNEQMKVVELSFNKDSTILAVWLESAIKENDTFSSYLQFWTTANYHWYLKHFLDFSWSRDHRKSANLTCFYWDPENSNTVHTLTYDDQYLRINFGWTVDKPQQFFKPNSDSTVAVVDGASLLLTAFNKALIPPPLCGTVVNLPGYVNHVIFSESDQSSSSIFAVLSDSSVALITNDDKPEQFNFSVKKFLRFHESTDLTYSFYHFKILNENLLIAVATKNAQYILKYFLIDQDSGVLQEKHSLFLPCAPCQMVTVNSKNLVLLHMENGLIYEINETDNYELRPFISSIIGKQCRFSGGIFCDFDAILVKNKIILICRNERHQLFIDGTEVANNINSYCIHQEFLILTSLAHQLLCIPIEDLLTENFTIGKYFPTVRNVERGSRIVTCVPADTKVILQMPRGNLEAVHPRCLVLKVVKRLLDECEYKQVMQIMKRHRLDTNLIYDHDPQKFLAKMDHFVDTVSDTMLFNIFLSELRSENVTETLYAPYYANKQDTVDDKTSKTTTKTSSSKVNDICLGLRASFIRDDVDQKRERKHFTSLLTTYAKMQPPDFDNALLLIKKQRDEYNDLSFVDEGLRHLLYLTDVNVLIDFALGTYDFDLVLMVVEKSQKDPKEFLPFLNELRRLDPDYRKYKIDLHLERYVKALKHISACGVSRFDECMQLIKQRNLYMAALDIFKPGTSEFQTVCSAYAEHLTSEKKHAESGLFYEMAEAFDNAINAYKNGMEWRLLFALLHSRNTEKQQIIKEAELIAGKLLDVKRYDEAATVYAEFCENKKDALNCLIDGALFQEAFHKIYIWNCPLAYIDDILKPGLKSYCRRTIDIVRNNKQLFDKYVSRLKVVRNNKRHKLDQAMDKGDLDFDDTYSETGSTVSGTSGTGSRLSTKASTTTRNRRITAKKERKRYNLKENSPYEDLALLNALNEIVKQMDSLQDEIGLILQIMLKLQLNDDGTSLQNGLRIFLRQIESNLDEIWPLKIDLSILPGPLRENILSLNDSISIIADHTSHICDYLQRNAIKLDPLLIRPRLRTDFKWALDYFNSS